MNFIALFFLMCPKQTAHDKVLVNQQWSEQVTDGRLYRAEGDKLIYKSCSTFVMKEAVSVRVRRGDRLI